MLPGVLAIAPLPPLPTLTNGPPWLGGLLFLLALLVLLLVRKAWRGNPRGTHPVCGQCGYDLRGRPEDADRCSECGNDLSVPGSVVSGGRVACFKSAMALLLAAVAIGYFAVEKTAEWSHSFNWMRFDSTQTVLVTAHTHRWQRAAHELARRAEADTISDADVPAVAALALAEQRSKSPDWTLTLERLRVHGRLPDDLWRAYAEEVVYLHLRSPERFTVRDLPWVRVQAAETTQHGSADVSGQWSVRTVKVNGERVEHAPVSGSFHRDAVVAGTLMPVQTIRFRPMPAGPAEIEVVIDIDYTALAGGPGRVRPRPGDKWRGTVTLRDSFIVTGADSP